MASLKEQTISSVFWSFLQKVGSRGIQFVVTILLARLLTPADFGLIGMLAVFIAFSQTLVEAGFNQALIQKKDADEEDFSSVFWINLVVSLFIYVILYFCAPLIADFYHQPKLINLTRVLSIVFVVNSFGYVQETRLKKQLDFKKLMWVHLPSTVLSGIVAIIMAFSGFGVWALVAQRLVMQTAFAVQLWIYSKWRPKTTFNKDSAKKLFSFGGRLMVSNLIHSVYDNIYLIVIGRFFPVATLGYYQNAKKIVDLPAKTLASVIKNVSFPVFSSIQYQDVKLKEGYRKIIQQVLFWICPILILSAVLAEPLFNLLLTAKWLPAVPYFQLICIWGVIYPLNSYNIEIVNVKGRSDLTLRLQILKKIIVTIGVVVSIPMGVWALVVFQVLNAGIAYFINSYYSGKFINYNVWEQLKDIYPIILHGSISGGLVFLLFDIIFKLPDWLHIMAGGIIGIGVYWLISWKANSRPYEDFIKIFNEQIKPKIARKYY